MLSDTMGWSSAGTVATTRWYGFYDSHTALVRYYVTLNGKMASIAATTANDDVYSLPVNGLSLTTGNRYRIVVRGVNRGGVSSALTGVVEVQGNNQLTVLREVCSTTKLCEKQYVINASGPDQNGCLPAYGTADGQPRSCYCSFAEDRCLDVSVDRDTVPLNVWNGFALSVNDGFSPGVDIDHQPFSNVLGGTWQVLCL